MAQDDRRSDQFVREVDEELRRDQLKALWNRFAPVIIGTCLLVVAMTAGYRGWIWWQERQAAEAGDRFMAALEAIEGENRAEGEAELAAIADEGEAGYSALARLRLAGLQFAAGEKEQALAGYDTVAADSSVSPSLRDLARVRAALIALDLGDLENARERAAALNQPGSPWRHAAREVLGLAEFEGGALEEARDTFTEMQRDAETPPDLWLRSGMMLSLIEGRLPTGATTDDAPSPDAASEGESRTSADVPPAGPDALPLAPDIAPVLPTLGTETDANGSLPPETDPGAETPIPPQ